MITLNDIKTNCRIDDDTENHLLAGYLEAAKLAVENQTNRKWYDGAVPEDDITGLSYNAATDQAMLLLIGHWYANRENVITTPLTEIPQGFWWLIQPYRIYSI